MIKLQNSLLVLTVMLLLISCGTSKSLHHKPLLNGYDAQLPVVKKHSDTLFSTGDNFLIKNKQNLWELYVSGDPLHRGQVIGALTQDLYQKQERIFFSKVQELIPSKFKQQLLRQFLKWYNRKLYLNIPEEYKTEIYGLSQYASDEYEFIAPNYLRNLYLHGAHDIGHALQDLALVGCSSIALWGDKTDDGQLLLGRNFDFYAGDEFAQNKIIAFMRPDSGHPFMMVTWGGMIGVVSGMNKQGLTVTINAGKSKIPLIAKTPISIVAREILQYASTIEEAVAIAQKREVFVSESIMVGSAKDHKAVLIEVSPESFGVYEVSNSSQLICANHFQSDAYSADERNLNQIRESHSQYRFERMEELISEKKVLNPEKMVQILRNRDGHENQPIGFGNEKALNQLLAHHGVVFQPEKNKVWVSSNPYQLGEFVCYDLNKIFSQTQKDFVVLANESENIAKDPFLNSSAYRKYEEYRRQSRLLDRAIYGDTKLDPKFISDFRKLNPELWSVYDQVGRYYYEKGWLKAAELEFQKALTKEITTIPDRVRIENYLKKIKRRRK